MKITWEEAERLSKNTNLITFKKSDNYLEIKQDEIVKVITTKNKTYVKKSTNSKNECTLKNYKNIGKGCYIFLKTGEICNNKYNREYKTDKQINKSMKELGYIIENNFFAEPNEAFITLTYSDYETDSNKVSKDYNYFIKKLKRKYPENEYKHIRILERQKNGRFHIHILLKDMSNTDIYYLNERVIQNLWSKGKQIDIQYMSEYKERSLEENSYQIQDNLKKDSKSNTESAEKKIKKLKSYLTKSKSKKELPSKSRIYSLSKNIERPIEEKLTRYEAFEQIEQKGLVLEDVKCLEVYSYCIGDREEKLINTVQTETYKKIPDIEKNKHQKEKIMENSYKYIKKDNKRKKKGIISRFLNQIKKLVQKILKT